MYGLMGKIRAHTGDGEQLLAYLLRAAEELSALEHCYLYVISRDKDDVDALWVTEIWRNQEDHQASLGHEAIRTLITSARPLIAEMSHRTEFQPIGGKGLSDKLA